MSIEEMKEKIVVEVNHLDDEKTLQQVLHILNANKESEVQLIDAMKNKDNLFKKHDGLLKRLS